MVDLLLDEGSDLVLTDGDLALDLGLSSAVLISVFSDARVDAATSVDGTVRGWWAEDADETFGSTLWQHSRAKATLKEVPAIVQAVEDALLWIVDESIAEEVAVTATLVDSHRLSIEVVLTRGTATQRAALWENLEDQEASRGLVTLGVSFR